MGSVGLGAGRRAVERARPHVNGTWSSPPRHTPRSAPLLAETGARLLSAERPLRVETANPIHLCRARAFIGLRKPSVLESLRSPAGLVQQVSDTTVSVRCRQEYACADRRSATSARGRFVRGTSGSLRRRRINGLLDQPASQLLSPHHRSAGTRGRLLATIGHHQCLTRLTSGPAAERLLRVLDARRRTLTSPRRGFGVNLLVADRVAVAAAAALPILL